MNQDTTCKRLVMIAMFSFVILALTAQGAFVDVYWDPDVTAGYQHGNGSWSTNSADTNWTASGTAPRVTWTNSTATTTNNANFTAGGGASLVTLNNSVILVGTCNVTGGAYTLLITNGAQLISTRDVQIGKGGANNSALVMGGSGLTSQWTMAGSGNHFYLGNTAGTFATNNVVTVDGAGYAGSSVITNMGDLQIGAAISNHFNGFRVINGGSYLANADLNVGTVSGASNSFLLVNSGSVRLGGGKLVAGGNNGSVVLTNNAQVSALAFNLGGNTGLNSNTGIVGGVSTLVQSGSSALSGIGNILNIVEGGNLTLTNSSGTLVSLGGTSNTVTVAGGSGGTSRLILTNGALACPGSGATMTIDGKGVDGSAIVMTAPIANAIMETGIGVMLMVTNGGKLFTGAFTAAGGISNRLVIAGAPGVVSMMDGSANKFTPSAVDVRVDGMGTDGSAVMTNMSSLEARGSSGRFVVTNGGKVDWIGFGGQTEIGTAAGANSNSVLVAGGVGVTSLWNNGFGNAYGYGYFNLGIVNATGNTVMVDGLGVSGSAVMINGHVSMGGVLSSMVVTNGGKLDTGILALGAAGSVSNTIVVAGGAGFSSVLIANGITLGATTGTTNSLYSSLAIDGKGVAGSAVATNTAALLIAGSGGRLAISAAGALTSQGAATIGSAAIASNNAVLVTGAGSVWRLGGAGLVVGGSTSTNNTLTTDQGGTVDAIGTMTVAPGNYVYLSGGTLGVQNLTYTNGPFAVGDGVQSATLKSLAGGTLSFSNGLWVSSNATLSGVGTVNGGAVGVIITNGANFNPGINGPGTLTVGGSNLTWAGGGVYDCEITNVNLGYGSGWDILNVSRQLVFAGSSPNFVVKMDSRGAVVSGFDPTMNYVLKILTYGSVMNYDASKIAVDASSAFQPSGYVWRMTNFNNSLWLAYDGTSPSGDATLVWKVPSNGNWSVNGNWVSGATASSSSANILNFGDNGTPYNATNNLGTFMLNKLELVNISGVTNVISGNPLVFTNNGAASPRMEYQSGGGVFVISNAIMLATNTVFGGAGGGTLIVAGNVTGGQPLLKEGPWTLALAGSNSFVNPVLVTNAGGVVRLDNNNAFAANNMVVSNATVFANVAYDFGGQNQSNRTALVTGSATVWTNPLAFNLRGTNNSFTLDSGARLYAGACTIGYSGSSACTLLLTNGARMFSAAAGVALTMGDASSSGNRVMVSGAGSLMDCGNKNIWQGKPSANNSIQVEAGGVITNCNAFIVGYGAPNNTLTLTNGGKVYAPLTVGLACSNCSVFVYGSASLFSGALTVGGGSGTVCGNQAVIDGGVVTNCTLLVGGLTSLMTNSANNTVVLTNGARMSLGGSLVLGVGFGSFSNSMGVYGSTLDAKGFAITNGVGINSWANQLIVGPGGVITNGGTLIVGNPTSTNNQLVLSGGTLSVSTLVATNALNGVTFTAGTLSALNVLSSNGAALVVGDGTQSATLNLRSGGTNIFADGLTITNNASLTGSGMLVATSLVYGTLSPGMDGIGTITNSGAFILKPGASTRIKIAAYTTPGTGWDLLVVTNGGLQLDGALNVVLTGGFVPTNTQSYLIMTNLGPLTVSGVFASGSSASVYTNANMSGKAVGIFNVVAGSQGVVLNGYVPVRYDAGTLLLIF